jgi:hypothetical protein
LPQLTAFYDRVEVGIELFNLARNLAAYLNGQGLDNPVALTTFRRGPLSTAAMKYWLFAAFVSSRRKPGRQR